MTHDSQNIDSDVNKKINYFFELLPDDLRGHFIHDFLSEVGHKKPNLETLNAYFASLQYDEIAKIIPSNESNYYEFKNGVLKTPIADKAGDSVVPIANSVYLFPQVLGQGLDPQFPQAQAEFVPEAEVLPGTVLEAVGVQQLIHDSNKIAVEQLREFLDRIKFTDIKDIGELKKCRAEFLESFNDLRNINKCQTVFDMDCLQLYSDEAAAGFVGKKLSNELDKEGNQWAEKLQEDKIEEVTDSLKDFISNQLKDFERRNNNRSI